MPSALQEILDILDLEPLEVNLFRGRSPQVPWQRVFGGQVIGQALVAACRTVDGRPPHSLHAYFLLPGDPAVPIIYEVDRIRDGKSFTTRRVVAIQHGHAIFTMAASFQTEEKGFEHQFDMPQVPAPETLEDEHAHRAKFLDQMPPEAREWISRPRPIEMRPVVIDNWLNREPRAPFDNVWIRATGPVPADPRIQQALLAYASDMSLLNTALLPHGRSWNSNIQMASLDHAMWFHRPFRVDEWLLYAQDSPSASGARGFNRGAVFRKDGALVASVVQEGLMRQRDDRRGG